jgi:DNA-binding CsgD family transcriptional regulator
MEPLRKLAGLAIKVLHRHHLATERAPGEPTRSAEDLRRNALAHLRKVFGSERHGLTQREAEVCAYIVLGYSALAISLNLGISVNTVTTHRKRAYAKLCVCSQNELFERYFTAVVAP